MKKTFILLSMLNFSLINYGQIIADHTVVDKFSDIPQYYIDQVKKMWVTYPGESHSQDTRSGMIAFTAAYPAYAMNSPLSGTPEAYTTDHLRYSRATWGDINNTSGWIYDYGEEDWFDFYDGTYHFSAAAVARTEANLTYCNSNGLVLNATGFGWCWDYNDGINADFYLTATQAYVDYCTSHGYSTKVFFTTGPQGFGGVLPPSYNYVIYQRAQQIRSYVLLDPTRILFDWQDILAYNDAGVLATESDGVHTFPSYNASNDGGVGLNHIGTVGAIRLAKAMWWMLARIAGWDGNNTSTWNGTISNIWDNAANWTGGIPKNNSNVIIPAGLTNYPTGSESQDFAIGSGKSFIIEPGAQVILKKLTNNGTLWLKSDASGIASLIMKSYIDNGTENIELFLTGGGDESNFPWHYISSPVTILSTDVFTTETVSTNNLAQYIESHPSTNLNLRWVAWDGWDYSIGGYPSTRITFNALNPGKGYNIYFHETNVKKTFGGTLNTQDQTESLSYTPGSNNDLQGWNLIGNPFSSGLNWASCTFSSQVDNAIYFTVNNKFASFVNGVGINGGAGLIPPMQGFFVKANQLGQTVTMPASARVNNFHNRYKGDSETIPLIRLKIENENASDETVIRFDEKAQNTFDSEFDAYKFSKTGTSVSLWTILGQVSYCINSIPFPDTITEIPVGINITKSGTFKLMATQMQGIDGYSICLVDKINGTKTDLIKNSSIDFTATEGMDINRFVIRISNNTIGIEETTIQKSIFNIYLANNFVYIKTLSNRWEGKSGTVDLIDITGKIIRRTNNAEFRKNSIIQFPISGAKGIYFVEIGSGVMRYVGKVLVR